MDEVYNYLSELSPAILISVSTALGAAIIKLFELLSNNKTSNKELDRLMRSEMREELARLKQENTELRAELAVLTSRVTQLEREYFHSELELRELKERYQTLLREISVADSLEQVTEFLNSGKFQ